jgi:hypothetical protein
MVDDDMKLTEQEKRIKLAEAARWKGISEQFLVGYAPWRTEPYSDRVNACPVDELECFPLDPLPDYFNDLNAVQELQDKLTNDQQFEFVYHLNDVLELVPLSSPASYREVVLFAFANATATQRSEALGKTLNLW